MWVIVAFIQFGMVACVTYLIRYYSDEGGKNGVYPLVASPEFYLLLIKIFVSLVLHIMILPELI